MTERLTLARVAELEQLQRGRVRVRKQRGHVRRVRERRAAMTKVTREPGQLAYEAWIREAQSRGFFAGLGTQLDVIENWKAVLSDGRACWAAAEQAGREAEWAAAVADQYEIGCRARRELLSFIRLHADRADTQTVSVEWLDAWAPELVSGEFSAIEAGKHLGESE